MIGQRFGRLVVVEELPQRMGGGIAYRCACDCGGAITRSGPHLRRSEKLGNTQGCGCTAREAKSANGKANATHGLSNGDDRMLYDVHRTMLRRCNDQSDKSFKNYGGRGITVCKEWYSITEFRAWALTSGYAKGLMIDRVDNDAGYSPDNCRWATAIEQARNTRSNRYLTAFGETKLLCEWVEATGLHVQTIRRRLIAGWPIERALTEIAVVGKNQFGAARDTA